MSQVCPSSSHQLVAAAMAFRRARRKFPKNFGLYCNTEEATKFDKTESLSGNEDSNDQENLLLTRNSSKSRPNQVKTYWNDECGENGSTKENLFQKPIICSCCRKRNEQCNVGDTLDIVPSKEHNEITQKNEFSKLEQVESCDSKPMKNPATESRNSNHFHGAFSYLQKRNSKEIPSKLDSVNLLYDRDQNETNNVKSNNGPPKEEKRNCNRDEHDCNGEGRGCKGFHRNLRCTFTPQKNNPSSSSISHACNCEKHSTLNLLQPHRDCCRQNRHCCHSHDHCHHRCDEYNRHSSKEKRLASDTCLCSSNNSNNSRGCNRNDHTTIRESTCNNCHGKDSEKMLAMQEQNDEELDDSVATINHKDSLCILVEKYKTNKKCKHKAYFNGVEFTDERRDECDKSFSSETCQLDENGKQGGGSKYNSGNDNPRFRGASIRKPPCRYGDCGQLFKEGDANQFKNLKSRLIKTECGILISRGNTLAVN